MNRNRPNLPKLNALDKVDVDSLCYCSIRITNIFVDCIFDCVRMKMTVRIY